MKLKRLHIFLLAGICLLAFILVSISRNRVAKRVLTTKQVVVATDYFDIGTKLTLADLEVKQFPMTTLPEGATSDPNMLVGQFTSRRVSRGQLVCTDDVVPELESAGYHDRFDIKTVSVMIDGSIDHAGIGSTKSGECISLWLSGEEIISAVRIYDVDLTNKRLELLVTKQTAEMLRDHTGAFRNGNPMGDCDP